MANADQALLRAFLAGDRTPVPLLSNPLAAALGGRLEAADESAGSVVLSFVPGPQFLQGAGLVQGGIVAAMLDFALAFAALSKVAEGGSPATATLSVNFLKPVRPGRCEAAGRIVRAGRKLVFLAGELSTADGPLATATSVMVAG